MFYLINPSLGRIELDILVSNIKNFTNGLPFRVCVGTDSDSKDGITVYATAVVVHRLGNGATYFYRKTVERGIQDMFTRLFREAELSVEMAEIVSSLLGYPPAIHLDIGHDGESEKVLNSLVGYVIGMGYECVIKPESFAAYKIAHRHTKR